MMRLDHAAVVATLLTLVLAGFAVFHSSYGPRVVGRGHTDGTHIRICNITESPYNVLGDGKTISTRAIQQAIDDCAGKAGAPGTVWLPAPGAYLSGALQLKSHLRLVIEAGASLLGSESLKDYPPISPLPSYCQQQGSLIAPLLGANQGVDIVIEGGGVVDGRFFTHGPRLVQFRYCEDIHLRNVTFRNSGFWMLHFYASRLVSVTDSSIISGITQANTDGIDIDSTSDVYVARNHIECGDDGVALKSGQDYCGRRFGRATSNVTIEYNFFNFSGGFAIGSEMSGNVHDVLFQHNVLRGDAHNQPQLWTWGPRVLCIKGPRGRGGTIANILVYNATCYDCDEIIRAVLNIGGQLSNYSVTPVVKNVTVQFVRGTTEVLGEFHGYPESPLDISVIDNNVSVLRTAGMGYEGCSYVSPSGVGWNNDPPVCNLTSYRRYLPNIYGGPASAYPRPGAPGYPTGALFAFSGIDGPTNTPAGFFGWFLNESYGVKLYRPNVQFNLGFGPQATADPAQDTVLLATNDALLVERSSSRVAVSWRDWATIIGFIEGPDANVIMNTQSCDDLKGESNSSTSSWQAFSRDSRSLLSKLSDSDKSLKHSTSETRPIDVHAAWLSCDSDAGIAFKKQETSAASGMYVFALCYGVNKSSAMECANEAVLQDPAAIIRARSEYIASLQPLADADEDRFQRKLLSVMKVNSLSPEHPISQPWQTTCRLPHRWMFLWDGMIATIAMNHVDPSLALDYIRSFLQFQDSSGHVCATVQVPQGCTGPYNAMVPNIALALLDNYRVAPDIAVVREMFPKLETYLLWYSRQRGDLPNSFLIHWDDAYEAGMDHEQTYCRLSTEAGCKSDHHSVDGTSYIIIESQALAQLADVLGLHDRADFWTAFARNTTSDLNRLMWDESVGFFRNRYFNSSTHNTSLQPILAVEGFYPLLIDNMPLERVSKIVSMLKSSRFWSKVPVPTVATDTFDFSSDLDRGPMWLQQNFYIIRGLRKYGYHSEADELKAISIDIVKKYYKQWGVVFEFYDALDETDPTQTLRKPPVADSGPCIPGRKGISGHCGDGGIRDYNFCAGLALLWLRGQE